MEGLRVLGRPEDFAELYCSEGVDEILYMDVVASLYNRNGLYNIISRTADRITIPISVGGGIRSVEDVRNVLRCGADKVIVNTAVVSNPELLKEMVDQFGSSTIAVAVEAVKQGDGRYYAFTNNGREYTGLDVYEWMRKLESYGAGEIVLTSVDRDGTGEGLDQNLIELSTGLNIPVVVHGGVGNYEHVKYGLKELNCDAIAISSMFHYEAFKRLEDKKSSGNKSFLQSGNIKKRINPMAVCECKKKLCMDGILVRN